jgi:hypothetical protein
VSHGAVAVEVHDGTYGLVNGKLLEVDAQAGELSVGVGEIAALQQWIITESNTGYKVTGAERNLLGLSEEFIWVPVQLQLTDIPDWDELFRPDLCGI